MSEEIKSSGNLMEGTLQGGLDYYITPEIYIPVVLGFSYMTGSISAEKQENSDETTAEPTFSSLGIEFMTGAGYKMGAFKGGLVGAFRYGLSNSFKADDSEGAEPSLSYLTYGGGVRLGYRVWEKLDVNFEGLYMMGNLGFTSTDEKTLGLEWNTSASEIVLRLGASWTF
jgi:hypothetical protein